MTNLLGAMTWPEVDAYLRAHPKDASVVIPVGPVEEHGPHMALQADITSALAVLKRVAEKHHCLIFPPIPLMVCGVSKPTNGTYSIEAETMRLIAYDVVKQLVTKGFRQVLWFTGHGGFSMKLIRQAMEQLQAEGLSFRGKMLNFEDASKVQAAITVTEGDMHAGEAETSRMLVLCPDDLHHPFPPPDFHPKNPDGSIAGLSQSGICGNPQLATAEKGEKITDDTVTTLVNWLCEEA